MRTMKDKERFFLVVKIFLHLNGPATSRQISQYIEKCPVNMVIDITPLRVALLLRGQKWIEKDETKNKIVWNLKKGVAK